MIELNLNISNVMQVLFLLFGLLCHYSGSEYTFLYKSVLAGLYFNWYNNGSSDLMVFIPISYPGNKPLKMLVVNGIVER